jgi:hypothetical protein
MKKTIVDFFEVPSAWMYWGKAHSNMYLGQDLNLDNRSTGDVFRTPCYKVIKDTACEHEELLRTNCLLDFVHRYDKT